MADLSSAPDPASLLAALGRMKGLALVVTDSGGRVRSASHPLGGLELPVGSRLADLASGAPRDLGDGVIELAIGTGCYQISVVPLPPDALLHVATDVTQRKRTEERLRRSEALLVDAQ